MNIINSLKSIITILLLLITDVLVLIGMAFILNDFTIGPWYNGIIIVISIFIANSLFWPILRRFLIKFMILTFGVGAIFINSLLFYCVSYYIPHVSVGMNASFLVPLAMSIAITFVSNITNVDYYDNYIKKISDYVLKEKKPHKQMFPGLIILEIDGLSLNVLKKAIDKNLMPTIKNWIEKTHTLKEWETDLSSQTGASQAGILHGNNRDIVAYRWVEKKNNNKIMVSGKLNHAPIIESRISDGNGLLSDNGVSITNMFTGDSPNPVLTSSRFKIFKNTYNRSLDVVFLEAYSFQRIFILFLWEILVEIKSQIMHEIKDIKPRLRRNLIYATIRAGANVLLREVATNTLIGSILKGDMDSAYLSYVGYDEVAHHSGVEDEDVWNVLKKIDLQFNRIKKAEKLSDRDYKFVILSDHGQGNGATFKQKYKITLANYVRSLLPEDMKVYNKKEIQDHFRDAYVTQNKQIETLIEKVDEIKNTDFFSQNTKIQSFKELIHYENIEEFRKKYASNLDYIRKHISNQLTTKKAKNSELIVLGSGNLGLIYLTQWKKRLKYEEIILMFPNLIPGLVKHDGIGFIVVDSFTNGPMVIGQDGIYYLNTDEIVGTNPLKNFGKNAAKHIKRHNTFNNMPDILVNSFYNPESDEICAFEELIGSHGGLGGSQTRPFIIYPSEWKNPGELIGSKSIYSFLKSEMNNLKVNNQKFVKKN